MNNQFNREIGEATVIISHDKGNGSRSTSRTKESKLISIRFPYGMIDDLKAIAEKEGIGYQILLKKWVSERIATSKNSQET